MISNWEMMLFVDLCRWPWRLTIRLFLPQRDIKMVGIFCFRDWIFFQTVLSYKIIEIFELIAYMYVPGKVQVSLVWNSRNENSHNFEKLNALANVSFAPPWLIFLLPILVLMHVCINVELHVVFCSFYGGMVDQRVTSGLFTLYGLTFRHQQTMWVGSCFVAKRK